MAAFGRLWREFRSAICVGFGIEAVVACLSYNASFQLTPINSWLYLSQEVGVQIALQIFSHWRYGYVPALVTTYWIEGILYTSVAFLFIRAYRVIRRTEPPSGKL